MGFSWWFHGIFIAFHGIYWDNLGVGSSHLSQTSRRTWHRPMIVQKLLFRCGAGAISCGKRPSKKTSALLWFATLRGFCAAKPDERTKWPFLFTAWEILQLRQLRSASRSQCVPISMVDFECTWTTNHCVCLGLVNECYLELAFSSISSRHRRSTMSFSTDEWYHTPPHPTPCVA